MTYQQFHNDVMSYKPKIQRRGQYAWNLLYSLRPDIADAIAGTKFDPFNNDDILPTFFENTQQLW